MRPRQVFGAIVCIAWFGLVAIAAAQQVTAAGDTIPSGWILKSDAGISLNQSTFNKAWSGDEVGTLSWIATFGLAAEYWLAPWAQWKNGLLLQFGQTHQQDAARERWLAPQKSSDKITYRGIVLFKFWTLVDPFVAFDVDSQFFTRTADPTGAEVTLLWTPTLFTESAGLARSLVKNARADVLARLGFAFKERLDRFGSYDAAAAAFASRTTTEGGFELALRSRATTAEDRTVFISELRVFKAVETSENDPVRREFWSAVDADWQNKLTNKVAKWFAFDLFWQILYDKQIDQRGQFKQTLGAGFTWQLI
jgi:hypothetical protein